MGIDARILVGDTGNWQFPAWYRRRDEGPHRRLATRSIGGDGGATGDATTAAFMAAGNLRARTTP